MSNLTIINIGEIFTGDIDNPLIAGPLSLETQNGKIVRISENNLKGAGNIIDVHGMTVCPGLIDSHVHPVFGDFTPRQNAFGYFESYLHGGVTSMISAGEAHLPGRPKDKASVKALALLAHKSFNNLRPSGVKMYAGALILSKGLQEKDFKDLSKEGVWLLGETMALGNVKSPHDVRILANWAKKFGMKVLIHAGPLLTADMPIVSKDAILIVNPDIICHLNGGPTTLPEKEIEEIIHATNCTIEVAYCGNLKSMIHIVQILDKSASLSRLIIGTDTPSGIGLTPLGLWRAISFISSFCGIPAETAVCFATGNTKNSFLLAHGTIALGNPADMLVIDSPVGSQGDSAKVTIECGDLPAISLVIIDGIIKVNTSRNTPLSRRNVCIECIEKNERGGLI